MSRWLGDTAKPFETVIRHATLASKEMRGAGWLAVEYEARAADERANNPWWKKRQKGNEAGGTKQRFATNASALREDYTALAKEIMAEFKVRQERRKEIPVELAVGFKMIEERSK
jgi:hypothetical protein